VLVLGAGGGQDVLQALHHQARAVDAVELNPHMLELVQQRFADFSGRPYSRPGVRAHLAEARGFVAGSRARYDLIQLSLVDAYGASSAGLRALSESYLYTVEALREYLRRLAPGGMLAITRWISLPPRDLLKLAATAIAALEADSVGDPGRRLALIRGWKTGTLIIRNGDFSPEDLARIRTFSRERSFDLDWLPDLRPGEANRYNRLARPEFPGAMEALLGPGRADFLERYKYFIEPASDDRPYFFHFFKWSSLPEWLALRERGGMPLMEWGYPVLMATLVQALLAGLVLILLPLGLAGRRLPRVGRPRVLGYFSALGLAFMFVEIAFIQKFMLFLSHPLYAVAVVLCGFLLFAGLGSRMSGRARGIPSRRRVGLAVTAIAAIALAYLFLLPELFRLLAGLPDAARIAVSLGLIAPLAFFMGMPFPLGLQSLAATAPAFLPWAWGINACVSVVAAALATLVAMHLGFMAVVVLALFAYLAAAWTFPRGPVAGSRAMGTGP
jgi:SAM-dependent methyltransferase